MNTRYIDPRSGETFPLDEPRWCGRDHAPLMLTPQSGITRDRIGRAVRSLWRYRAALPLACHAPITMGSTARSRPGDASPTRLSQGTCR